MDKMVDGIVVAMTEGEIAERIAQEAEAEEEIAASRYKYARADEYPSIEDQLDNIYHNGIDGWKATIKTVKDKYPKP